MAKNKGGWVPVTPAGTPVFEEAADTEAKAWENLLRAAAHMPYKTKENFVRRGYTVQYFKTLPF